MSAPASAANGSKDWSTRPVSSLLWWVLPIVVGVSMNFFEVSLAATALVWALAFAWMGTGCVLNARRCRRLHCLISGPVLWIGAIAAGLVGLGVVGGAQALDHVIWTTLVITLLCFAPEMIWGKYTRQRGH